VALPTNVASAYPDDSSDPSIQLHQEHHDIIHAAVNAFMPVVVKTGAEWRTSDVVLQSGQFGIASDTGVVRPGNGAGRWDDLPSPVEEMAAAISAKVDKITVPVSALDTAYGLTGSTDNTAAMQDALDAAAAAGRNIHFPMRAHAQPYTVGGSGVMLKVAAGVNITADPGVVFKVKNNNGNYKAILGGTTSSTDLSGLVVQGVTFDQNTSGNAVSDVKTLYVDGTQRFCVLVGVGSVIRVKDCTFRHIDGLNTIYAGGPAMKDVRIQDCEFDLVGTSPRWHDHSTLYISCDGLTITGNKFRGILGGPGSTTAIETHGPSQVVTSNRVEGYKIGANITGITKLGNDGVIVSANVIRNALIGIQLWSYTGANDGLRDCAVTDNVINLTRDPWIVGAYDFPKGVCLAATSTDHVDGLTITGNRIRFGSSSAAALTGEYQANGIDLVTTDSTRELRNFDISDNTVIGALGPGMRLQMVAKRGRVSGNYFIDPASSTETAMPSFWKSAMTFLNDLSDVDVYGNRLFDTRGIHKVAQMFATSITGAVTRCEQWDNKLVCLDGASLPESVQTSGKRFSPRAAVPVATRFATALYYGPEGARSTANLSVNQATAVPFWVGNLQRFDRIGCEVTVAGAASSVVRLGVYVDNGSGLPGELVFEAGTVAGGSTGAKEIKISKTLPAGLYWLVLVGQGGTPQVRAVSNNILGGAGVSTLALATGATPRPGYYMTGVSGALPHTWTMSGQTATPGVVVLRAA
jgi:hypothetical protein